MDMLASLCLLSAPVAALTPPQFGPPQSLSAAVEDPIGMQLADMNGDGVLDVFVATGSFSINGVTDLSYFEGLGGGAFGSVQRIAPRGGPFYDSPAIGDIDGDGTADVVAFVASTAPAELVIVSNRGDGAFDDPVSIGALEGSGTDLVLVDWDLDGDLDIVASTAPPLFPNTPSEFVLLENLGGGVLAAPADLAATSAEALEMVAGDVDGDGDSDLVVADLSGAMSWYRNDGTPPALGPIPVPSSTFLRPFAIEDVDGDGDADVLSSGGGRVEWSSNLGGGTFAPSVPVAVESSTVRTPGAADLDLDGDLDVFCMLFPGNPVWYENDGTGSFAARQDLPLVAPSTGREIVAGDVDADGRVDLVQSVRSPRIDWIRNVGTGAGLAFNDRVEVTSRAEDVRAIGVADLDGDGLLDVFGGRPAADFEPASVVIARGDAAQSLQSVAPLIEPSEVFLGVTAGDLDSDGDLDALGRSVETGEVILLENPGNGDLVTVGPLPQSVHFDVQIADVDGDGDSDVALLRFDLTGTVLWYEQSGGALLPPQILTTVGAGLGTVGNGVLRFADLDGDGTPDLLSTTYELSLASTVQFLRGLGGGAFAAPVALRTPVNLEEFSAVEIADIDGDGDLDPIGVGLFDAPVLAWYPNQGGGAFGAEVVIEAPGDGLRQVAPFDVDLDGDVDLVASGLLGNGPFELFQWTNRGDGTFEPVAVVSASEEAPLEFVVGDFDRDGDTDVVAATHGVQGLALFPNQALGGIGEDECASLANSTGSAATTTAFGSDRVALGRVQLRSADLPANSAGYYLVSLTPDTVVGAGGSQGVLCLGGAIGRFIGPGQVLNAGADGAFSLDVDLAAVPQPNGSVAVMAGQTWRFQAWYRDAIGGVATSNFTNGLAIQFR